MKAVSSILPGALLLLATIQQVAAVAITCDPKGPFRQPEWTCDICGNYLVGSAPIRCGPGNITFDDLPVGPLTETYQRTSWTSFSVVSGNSTGAPLPQLARLKPASPPNFARLPAGKSGLLNLAAYQSGTTLGGTLYSLRYGCTLANTGIPVACRITFDGICFKLQDGNDPNAYKPNSTTLTYSPAVTLPSPFGRPASTSLINGTMAYAKAVGPQDRVCTNYTIKAESLVGAALPVDLYFDEVLHAAWWLLGF